MSTPVMDRKSFLGSLLGAIGLAKGASSASPNVVAQGIQGVASLTPYPAIDVEEIYAGIVANRTPEQQAIMTGLGGDRVVSVSRNVDLFDDSAPDPLALKMNIGPIEGTLIGDSRGIEACVPRFNHPSSFAGAPNILDREQGGISVADCVDA